MAHEVIAAVRRRLSLVNPIGVLWIALRPERMAERRRCAVASEHSPLP